MKLFLRMILIGVLTYFLSAILPWWILVAISLIVGLVIPGGAFSAFVSGFLGVGITWMAYAWKLDTINQSNFSNLILEIIPLGDSVLLIAITGFLGGILAGFSCMTGSLLRKKSKKNRSSGYYQ